MLDLSPGVAFLLITTGHDVLYGVLFDDGWKYMPMDFTVKTI